ncbi:hypothetical protein ACHHYP_15219 [Achlya hypogyna]|uniref:inosine/xanthosine triphosphatase n=1 Tax=Achlya hypogyna TaxID=1202772 RepID=A0A1V9YBG2_ACHHY|nr:hypothetical protein ACHHYP_15219 [Achlya hypogyna]
MLRVELVVASKNPVKIAAALDGFRKLFPHTDCSATGVDVPSGVPDQPMTSDETRMGAANRAAAAKAAVPTATYWVGIEGGIEAAGEAMEVFAWIVVLSRDAAKVGMSKTANFYLPAPVIALVNDGVELGHADDQVFGRSNSKQKNGAVGLLTNDVITRSSYYEQAVLVIASKNPVKIAAALDGFRKIFPGQAVNAIGIDQPSGVRDQPMTSRETLDGARNRATGAKAQHPSAHYWLGIEGGIEPVDGSDAVEEFAWIVVLSRDDAKYGVGRTASFYLPAPLIKLVGEGLEVGHAADQVFGKSNSKQKNGTVGLLTGDAITRSSYYEQAVVLAFVPFKNPDLNFPQPQ